jgi:S-adenosylmethionine:tRNA ribosyltransferase-isomerase
MSLPAFELPRALEATEPPEARGIARDQVKLMVARRTSGQTDHVLFRDLPRLLRPGDLLVVNVSATIPAAIAATRADGARTRVHFSTRAPRLGADWRTVELRTEDGARPEHGRQGERLNLAGGATLELMAPYASGVRLHLARFEGPGGVEQHLGLYGEPIRYGYVTNRWPLGYYQTVYATTPGSSEMASAGRPFTRELLARLTRKGVMVASVTLHAGVSSPERHEPPFAEYYEVPASTAALVKATRRSGGRVIAVGTTVVRALETAAVRASRGWTGLVITPERGVRMVDGLITGWHEPDASHLQLLAALADEQLLARSYAAAVDHGYLWHEFGDSCLILP